MTPAGEFSVMKTMVKSVVTNSRVKPVVIESGVKAMVRKSLVKSSQTKCGTKAAMVKSGVELPEKMSRVTKAPPGAILGENPGDHEKRGRRGKDPALLPHQPHPVPFRRSTNQSTIPSIILFA
jgi:hypothetical protein